MKRVFIRPVMNDEGLGSALQRMKGALLALHIRAGPLAYSANNLTGSIVLAEVVADATFLLGEAESEHHYSTSRILNAKYFNNVSLPLGKSCVLSHYLPVDQRVDLVHSVCAGEKPAQATELRQRLAPCHIIIDDVPDELYQVRNLPLGCGGWLSRVCLESAPANLGVRVPQDVSGCIRPFVRDRLDGIDQRRLGTARKLSVGVHIRWGDAAHEPGATRFRGSMDLDHINTIIHDARERFAPLDIRVIMENHDDSVLDKLTFGDYTLVDSGDSMADLKMLADNDLLLLGSSSYGVLSHLLAPKGLSIVEGGDEVGKYTDSGEPFFAATCLVMHVASCSVVDPLLFAL